MTKREKVKEIAGKLNVIDDALFQKMAEDIGFCEELLSTILEQKIKVVSVTPQNSIKNLQGRSVVLDALCTLEDGNSCNIEVQKADDDNHEKRIRYNTSCITANVTEPGKKFEKVPNVIGIFISRFDIFGDEKTVYHVDRTVRETGKIRDNGLQEIYVNAKIDDGTDVAELMRIFKDQSTYDFTKFPKISSRKRQFLQGEGGEKQMCELIDNLLKDEARETASELFKNGASYDLVRNSIKILSDEELKDIYQKAMQGQLDA